ncbi:hypothetical protein KZ813_07355 [Sphingomonas sp. RHCKR7]|uniref:hypothetical protein n=1 Tax=Sphingomonas folli TaxID=2862497 RepID=UPI001CA563D8|nr:hypothetical protein [Sphingomonas folli]MBW6526650.1 hypothetical protein [Sphingomonas folli]
MTDPRDLGGTWYGRYEGADGVQSNQFIARLSERDGALSGTISEPDDLGLEPVRRALVSGRRDGAGVAFVKQYDGEVLVHAVDYRGTVDPRGTEVRGDWSFADYAGSFAMTRERFDADELAEAVGDEAEVAR